MILTSLFLGKNDPRISFVGGGPRSTVIPDPPWIHPSLRPGSVSRPTFSFETEPPDE